MIGRPIMRLDSVASTQDLAFRLGALGAVEGTTVVARYQTAGRGRGGRAWTASPDDALMFSVVLRLGAPPSALGPFSILVADAIAETVHHQFGLSPQVKWPNDVLIGGRKLSGVLIQVRGEVGVLGVGINVLAPKDRLPEEATSLSLEIGREVSFRDLLPGLLEAIDDRYGRALKGDVAPAIDRVNARLYLRGETATVHDGSRMLGGRVLSVREDGALMMLLDDGVRPIVSGELVRGPRKAGPV